MLPTDNFKKNSTNTENTIINDKKGDMLMFIERQKYSEPPVPRLNLWSIILRLLCIKNTQ